MPAWIQELGQALVHWLWAFLFFWIGLASVVKHRAMVDWTDAVGRSAFLGIGGGALIICSLNLYRVLRRKP